ncbi:DUF4145 domain-containing protein [Microvirga sp. W0021]|uniref:DUF4145 domain-containing protein n=1 Tax=Hohaiivirga grylli TaxID=3133970 RepID=A0ABV0BEP9_9HYPH
MSMHNYNHFKTSKAHCPSCNGDRICKVYGCKTINFNEEEAQIHGEVTHSLLQCCGCEAMFYEVSSWNSEEIDYSYDDFGNEKCAPIYDKCIYPKPEIKNKPTWLSEIEDIDITIFKILNEVYIAYENDAHTLATVGLRTVLDRATEILNIDPAITFKEKLENLKTKGFIGGKEFDILEVVIDAGNAAAHRGWITRDKNVRQLLSTVEIFIERSLVQADSVLQLKKFIPEKPKRVKTT